MRNKIILLMAEIETDMKSYKKEFGLSKEGMSAILLMRKYYKGLQGILNPASVKMRIHDPITGKVEEREISNS